MTAADAPCPSPPPARGLPWGRALLVVLFLAAVAGFYASGLYHNLSWQSVRGNLDAWQEQARRQPVAAVVVFFLAYVALTSLSLPAAGLMTLLGGALFGRALGLGVASLAATCGAAVAFLGSRYLFRDWVRRRLGHRLRAIDAGIHRDGAWYLFGLRLMPVFPYFLINLGMALTPMPLGTFVLVTWLGMVPNAFLYVNAGTELGRIAHPAEAFSPAVLGSLALAGVAPLVARWLARRWRTA
jgi:uncharacterized membrane protein YdjX (TVP38/TMEM64 family)